MADWHSGLSQLSARHDTIAIYIQDETDTIIPPLRGEIAVCDWESGTILPLDTGSPAARRQLQAHIDTESLVLKQALQRAGNTLILGTPTTDYAEELLRVFLSRSTTSRT